MTQADGLSHRHNEVTGKIIDSAIKVHRALGPGLLESVYERCLEHELMSRGLRVERQRSVRVTYGDLSIDAGLIIDLLVEDLIVVELKAVEQIIPLYDAQLFTYLKLSNKKLGLLINFNVPLLKNGIKRLVLSSPTVS